jgi:hypothetical protein
MRTSENSVKQKLNFRESDAGEVRRIHLLGTWVNKDKEKAGAALRPGPVRVANSVGLPLLFGRSPSCCIRLS